MLSSLSTVEPILIGRSAHLTMGITLLRQPIDRHCIVRVWGPFPLHRLAAATGRNWHSCLPADALFCVSRGGCVNELLGCRL